MYVKRGGRVERVDAFWQDHWKVIRLPIFPYPASIDGRPYERGIVSTSMDVFELYEREQDIARKHNADRILPPSFTDVEFARFIAKQAYGYAVERYGLDAFETVYPVPAILGEADDIGRWVGCSDRRELPVRECNISGGFKIIDGDDLVVKLKMFPRFDGAEYIVVIGKVKALYRDLFHARGEQG